MQKKYKSKNLQRLDHNFDIYNDEKWSVPSFTSFFCHISKIENSGSINLLQFLVECKKIDIKKRKKNNLKQNSYKFRMWLKLKVSKVSEILIWPYTSNKKHRQFEKFDSTLNFDCFDCIKPWRLDFTRLQVYSFKKIILSLQRKSYLCMPPCSRREMVYFSILCRRYNSFEEDKHFSINTSHFQSRLMQHWYALMIL